MHAEHMKDFMTGACHLVCLYRLAQTESSHETAILRHLLIELSPHVVSPPLDMFEVASKAQAAMLKLYLPGSNL
jgi:hypothetical protein